MIFASDLDQTLIYSKRFLNSDLEEIVVVEKREEENISHMTQKSINLLKLIHDKFLFIPTTTRSMEQYKRINLFNTVIRPRYAVVANGGIILNDGEIDSNWQERIDFKMKKIISPSNFLNMCDFFLAKEYIQSYRCCDGLFIYAVLKSNSIDIEALEILTVFAEKHGYNVNKTGRKVYIIPEFINKWSPLEYIMKKEKEKEIITAGDSWLDLPMLSNAKKGLVPLHGELYEVYKDSVEKNKNIYFTNQQGILCSEELLKNVVGFI